MLTSAYGEELETRSSLMALLEQVSRLRVPES